MGLERDDGTVNPLARYLEELTVDDPIKPIDPIEALKLIRDTEGKVCENFELCTHRACNSSYSMWAIADACLTSLGHGPST